MAALADHPAADDYRGETDRLVDDVLARAQALELKEDRMTPGITAVRMTGAKHRDELPLLVLGPSLGTSASTLWTECARGLTDVFDVVAWDLPGHGHNRAVPDEPFTMAELAAGVLAVVDDVLLQRGQDGGPFFYAGDSVGGAVGLQLLLDRPTRVAAAALLCTGARIGDEAMWTGRIGQVSVSGHAGDGARVRRALVRSRLPRPPARGRLRAAARAAGGRRQGYIQVCGALARFDVRDRLAEIGVPVLAVAGSHDVATPPELLRAIADGVKDGRYVELDGVAHLAPAEAPEAVASLLRQHFLGEAPSPATTAPSARSATPGWSYGVRCWATRTSTARTRPPPTSRVTSRS